MQNFGTVFTSSRLKKYITKLLDGRLLFNYHYFNGSELVCLMAVEIQI
jgi:hypothetical protein